MSLKNKNVVHLSHTDLDGSGCQILTYNTFSYIKNFNSTYGNITKNLKIIDEHLDNNSYDMVFITDLSFTEDDFKLLYKITKKHKDLEFIYIDHHPYDYDINQYKTDNFKILVSDKYSATKLTYKFLNKFYQTNDNSNKEITLLVEYINSFDIWLKDDDKYFKGGLVYNEIFWNYRQLRFFNKFKHYPHKLNNKEKELFRTLMKKKTKLYDKCIKNKRLFTFNNKRIFVIFLDEFGSHITLDYPNYSTYIIVRSYGGMSIRIDPKFEDNGKFKDNLVENIVKLDEILNVGGHNLAIGVTFKKCENSNQLINNQFRVLKKLTKWIDIELDRLEKKLS